MSREDQTRPFYNLTQSAIVQTPYSPTKQLPSLQGSFSNYVDSGGKKSSQGLSTFEGNGSNGSTGFSKYLTKNNEANNQYQSQYNDRNAGPMSRSTFIDTKLLDNHSSKTADMSNSNQKTFNKYVGNGTSKIALNKTQEQPEDSPGKEANSPTYQKKHSQNFSFQFSPKKLKSTQEQQGSIRQFIVVEPKAELEKNNLDSYKKVGLDNDLKNKRSPTAGQSSSFTFKTIPINSNNKAESPNNSIEQTKGLRRKFSSGNLNAHLKGLIESPQSSSQTNYFYTKTKNPNASAPVTNPKRDDFVTIKQLGKGKYGDVFLSQHRHSRIICALKVISKKTILEQDGGLNQFIREVTIQMYLTSNYIIELWGIFSDNENVYLILEPALDGQLYKYMKQRGQLDEEETAEFIRHLCEGVRYLQEEKIIHRDLKPENILLHEGKIKICDFGWAVYNENSFRDTFCGTPLYLSPDVLKGEQYNDKIDNWAIGIITYEMLVGKIPFKITKESEMEKILYQEIQFPEYIQISDVAKDFILSLLDRDPDTRMHIQEMLVHKFLAIDKLNS